MPDPRRESGDEPAATTMHVRRAMGGDRDSLDWIVERLTPLLVAQAEYRLGPALRREVDPEDLVNEAWLVALPRLAELAHHERVTPVLLKFLTTTMVYRVNHLLRRRAVAAPADAATEALGQLPAHTSGAITRAVRGERAQWIRQQIEALDASDREVIVLRGIEQHPSQVVAVMLAITPAAVDQRYSRAIRRLRTSLPGTVVAELDD